MLSASVTTVPVQILLFQLSAGGLDLSYLRTYRVLLHISQPDILTGERKLQTQIHLIQGLYIRNTNDSQHIDKFDNVYIRDIHVSIKRCSRTGNGSGFRPGTNLRHSCRSLNRHIQGHSVLSVLQDHREKQGPQSSHGKRG
jgi:hypothetical protein